MPVMGLVMGVMLAIAGIISGIYALRGGGGGSDSTGWHDTSLDDWRRERDAAAEAERQARLASPRERSSAEGEEPHERVGG